jgi:hypothetical protein
MNAGSQGRAMNASRGEHAMGATNGESVFFPSLSGNILGRLGRCQGFASPRKNRAPLTPSQPSDKSY